jgi:hypothetical protein
MSVNQILPKYLETDTKLFQTTQSEVKINSVKPNEMNVAEIVITWGVGISSFFIFWAFFWVALSKIMSVVKDNQIFLKTKPLSKLPCQNCKYFSSNYYMRCAVNPSLVMTKEAKDCSDYLPDDDDGSSATDV